MRSKGLTRVSWTIPRLLNFCTKASRCVARGEGGLYQMSGHVTPGQGYRQRVSLFVRPVIPFGYGGSMRPATLTLSESLSIRSGPRYGTGTVFQYSVNGLPHGHTALIWNERTVGVV